MEIFIFMYSLFIGVPSEMLVRGIDRWYACTERERESERKRERVREREAEGGGTRVGIGVACGHRGLT